MLPIYLMFHFYQYHIFAKFISPSTVLECSAFFSRCLILLLAQLFLFFVRLVVKEMFGKVFLGHL